MSSKKLEVRTIRGLIHQAPRRAILDPNKFTCSKLAAEFGDLWFDHCMTSGVSVPTASSYSRAVKSLCQYIDSHSFAGEASLYGGPVDVAEEIFRWRTADPSLAPASRAGQATAIMYLLRRAMLLRKPLREGLSELAARLVSRSGRSAPLDEFSNKERLAQVRVATSEIRDAEQRVARGQALYEANADFRQLIDIAMSRPGFATIRDDLQADPKLVRCVETALGRALPTASGNAIELVGLLGSLLAPTPLEIIGFQVLLMWSTGFSPEQITDTKISDLEFGDSSMVWTTYKARAQTLMHPTFGDTASREPWGTVGLFSRSVAITSFARRLTGNMDELWLAPTLSTHRRCLTLMHPNFQKPNFAAWIAHHRIEASLPHDRRRIRKAVKAVRAELSGSVVEAAGQDHSVATFNRHYAPMTSIISVSARVAARAQSRIFERVIEGSPLVIAASATESSKTKILSEKVRMLAEVVSAESPAERAIGISACADPTDSPYAPQGEICVSRPFACLRCPNAVIFGDHLPQLLAMSDFVEKQRITLDQPEFIAVWGEDFEMLGVVLSVFDGDALEHARQLLDTARESLLIPIDAKVGFGQ